MALDFTATVNDADYQRQANLLCIMLWQSELRSLFHNRFIWRYPNASHNHQEADDASVHFAEARLGVGSLL